MMGSEDDKQLWRKFKEISVAGASAPHPPTARAVGPLSPHGGARRSEPSPPPAHGREREARASARAGEGGLTDAAEEQLRLAAWIDGRLEGAEREAVEARLAGDPALLDLAVSAARSRNLSAPWPKRAESRAAALIAPARPGWRWVAAAAAAVMVVALGGFEMGRTGSELLSADAETDLAAELGLLPETDLMETLL